MKYQNLFTCFHGFTIKDLLNDIDHIIIYHDKSISHGLFRNKIGVCDSDTCHLYSRRYTKHNISQNALIDTQFAELIARISFLEQIHSYLFHSFSNKNSTQIWKHYKRSNPERKLRYDMNDGRGIFMNNQGHNVENVENDEMICNESKEDDSSSNSAENDFLHFQYDDINVNEGKLNARSPFSTGHRYEYYQFDGSRRSKFYCGCKYSNLKTELTDDRKKNVTMEQFNQMIISSDKISETSYSKKLKCRKLNNNEVKTMSKTRVFSIKLYCDNGELASALKRTFLKLPGHDAKKERAEQRREHSRFGHWAKLLLTTVDLFGKTATSKQKFYRGYKLDDGDRFKFTAFAFQLFGPISTSSNYGVALNFTEGSGIILQLQKGIRSRDTRYFDCRHYSAFKEEAELLFFGYDNHFNVTKISEGLLLQNGKDTRPVLLLQSLISKHNNRPYQILKSCENENVIRLLNGLLMDYVTGQQTGGYLSEIVNNFVRKGKIYIRLNILIQIQKWVEECRNRETTQDLKNLYHFFVDDGDLMYRKNMFQIEMNKITKLFAKCIDITFNFSGWNHKLCKNNTTWMNLIKFMIKNEENKTKLKKILLKNISPDQYVGNGVLWNMAHELINTKWKIYEYIRFDGCKSLMFMHGSSDSFHHRRNRRWKLILEPNIMKYKRKAKQKLLTFGNKLKNTRTNSNDQHQGNDQHHEDADQDDDDQDNDPYCNQYINNMARRPRV